MIVSFDPGVTTGYALLGKANYVSGQLDSNDLRNVYDYLEYMNPDVVGYEDFKHRPGLMNAELYSKEVIGVIRLWCLRNQVPEPFKYLPSTAKAFWTDDKIKALGLWEKGKGHAMDALRVLLKYQYDHDADWRNEALRKIRENNGIVA